MRRLAKRGALTLKGILLVSLAGLLAEPSEVLTCLAKISLAVVDMVRELFGTAK